MRLFCRLIECRRDVVIDDVWNMSTGGRSVSMSMGMDMGVGMGVGMGI